MLNLAASQVKCLQCERKLNGSWIAHAMLDALPPPPVCCLLPHPLPFPAPPSAPSEPEEAENINIPKCLEYKNSYSRRTEARTFPSTRSLVVRCSCCSCCCLFLPPNWQTDTGSTLGCGLLWFDLLLSLNKIGSELLLPLLLPLELWRDPTPVRPSKYLELYFDPEMVRCLLLLRFLLPHPLHLLLLLPLLLPSLISYFVRF